MRTRSQARKRRQQQVRQTSVESPNLEKPNNNPPIVTMADNRTMAQLLEAPTEGYEDAIVVPEITANNFEIKHGLLNLVQNKQFFGHDKEDPHAHIRYFNKITSTMKFPNVPSTSVKLMLFPFSLEGAARIWLEKEPPRSILTWDDLDMDRALILDKNNQTPAPDPVKSVEQSLCNCGGGHYQNCSSTDGKDYVTIFKVRDIKSAAVTTTGNASYRPSDGCKPNSTSPFPPMQNSETTNRGSINQPPTFQAPPYQAPAPVPPAPEMENKPEVTKDTVQQSTENIQPPVVQTDDQIGEPVIASKTKPTLHYPSRANKEKLREKDDLLA
ncbi:hypothetical protein Tco_1351892 [Tanacetum coccineum]